MKVRVYVSALAAFVAGCSALEGLSGGDDDPVAPDRTTPPACSTANAPKCGDHGRCVENNSVASCACDTGFTGPTCSECAIGGSCSTVTCAQTKCAAHSVCEESGGSASCKCVVGYAQSGKDCAWRGVILDPAFQNEPVSSWKLTGGVTIDPNAPGGKDPGSAELKTATCSSASVSQSFLMPSVESAEPLAMELFGKGRCEIVIPFPGSTIIPFPCLRPISMTISGRGVEPFPFFSPNTLAQTRMCLGDGAYGTMIDLTLFPSFCSGITKSTIIDHVDIVTAPATECPAPGQVLNGDFEGVGGWTVSGTGAEVAPNVGNKSSRGGQLHNAKRCDAPRLAGMASVRMKTPAKPALTFTMKGTLGRRMNIYVNNYLFAVTTGTAVYENVTLCLPEHIKGLAGALTFALEDDKPVGVCGDPDDYSFVFDDLKIDTDTTCEDPALVVDGGGFERTDTARYWVKAENGGSVGFLRTGGTNAHAGQGFALMSQSTCDKATSMRTTITAAPPSPGTGGPAVEFFYKATTATAITYSGPNGALTPTTTWTRAIRCIDPRRASFPLPIEFYVSAGSSCSPGSLFIDDVRAVHDPSCPE